VKQKRPTAFPRKRVGGRSARVVASTHAAVLDALAKNGYEALSIAEIARQAGVHETSIYRRWPTKGQLVSDAIIRSALEDIAVPDTGSFQQDMLVLLQRVVKRIRTPVGIAVSQVVVSQVQDLAELRRAYWTSRKQAITPIVARAKQRGELPRSVQPQLVLELFSGPMVLRYMSGNQVSMSYLRNLAPRVIAALNASVAAAMS
jgi:AcrR family transcriptional regulator